MTVHTIRGRIVLVIVVVGCIRLLTCLSLVYVSGMRSLRDVIGGIRIIMYFPSSNMMAAQI